MSAADDEAKNFRNGLMWAANREAQALDHYPNHVLAMYDQLNKRYRRFAERELEQIVQHRCKDACQLTDHGGFIYLAACMPSWTVPVMTALWDFNSPQIKTKLRIALFHPNPVQPDRFWSSGYRFELPEANRDHAYHHAQPITCLVPNELCLGANPGIATTSPTFPLDADGPATLLLCSLMSLYGLGILGELRPDVPKLEALAGKMRGLKSS